jgi:hypothetical protein
MCVMQRKVNPISLPQDQVIKVDLGCGYHKLEGFLGIDMLDIPGVDIVHDLETTPWPLPSESITLLSCSNLVSHINPNKHGFISFMNEAWRVLKYGGQFRISTSYGMNTAFMSDPTNVNPCTHQTWHYFDPITTPQFYKEYKPMPWKVEQCYWSMEGVMEVLLSKRRLDPSYML